METNRSLRTIKNELESLLEKGVITEDVFDSIQTLLPTEASLSAAASTPSSNLAPTQPPRRTTTTSPAPPTSALGNLSLNNPPPGPPSYAQSTGVPPPALPARNQPPPPPPGKPVIAHARALYHYSGQDARDCSFERDDKIEVYEYMNADWWMGRNVRTGVEGIFPQNYVEPEAAPSPYPAEKVLWPPATPAGGNAYPGAHGQGAGYMPPQQPTYGGYPPPPGQVNPYNAHAPPMAVANQDPNQHGEGSGSNKFSEGGKKIGKKLGNAAIFGAGATIGSNIVNSIF
ncbi:hypothetical protein DL546_007265 [Coniochaeta pulveracea]|uniref:SH3 domain-containing protein n=1 Tax=Coniochaeta pulveracea TaxID=177199 RepID=A0A420Y8Z2_9PEZI|nr:hypothetical protein DL546_007265 [Coniochaeta pulveracea]